MPVPLISTAASAATERSLRAYRERLARELGLFVVGSVTTPAAGPEAERFLISSALRSDERAPDYYDDLFCYVRDGVQATAVRRLISGGYDGPEGAIRLDYPFGAPLAAGVTFEMSVLPRNEWQGVSGLNDLIGLATRELWAPDRLDVPVVANQWLYPLPTYKEWLDRPELIEAVYEPPLAPGMAPIPSAARWRLKLDGGIPTLELLDGVFTAATGTLQLAVRRPAYTLVNGAESTRGPESDLDVTLALEDEVIVVALVHAYRELATAPIYEPEVREKYLALASQQAEKARRLARYRSLDAPEPEPAPRPERLVREAA
jgi:hypothetical protein